MSDPSTGQFRLAVWLPEPAADQGQGAVWPADFQDQDFAVFRQTEVQRGTATGQVPVAVPPSRSAIVQALRAAGIGYWLTVKDNQPPMAAACADAEKGTFAPEVQDRCETCEPSGVPAQYCVTPASMNGWRTPPCGLGLRSPIRVQMKRIP